LLNQLNTIIDSGYLLSGSCANRISNLFSIDCFVNDGELLTTEVASFWLRHPANAAAPPGRVPNLKMFIAAFTSRSRISPQYRHLW
jgi:hypothetical protein